MTRRSTPIATKERIVWLADGYKQFRMISTGQKFYLGRMRPADAYGFMRLTRRVFDRARDAIAYTEKLVERYERICK